jgi:Cyclic nucleotide-binding domain/FHA domain
VHRRRFADGEVIIVPGHAGEALYRVHAGTVALHRLCADGTTRVETIGAGGVFGAEALFEDGDGALAASAAGPAEIDIVGHSEFRHRLTGDPALAAAIAVAVFESADRASAAALAGTVSKATETAVPRLILRAADDGLAGQFPPGGIPIEGLPFGVGRAGEGRAGRSRADEVQLALSDDKPYHLSRRHFVIEMNGRIPCVRDCGSFHGTRVNGTALDADNRGTVVALHPGVNKIAAGRRNTPFRFVLVVGED